MAFAFYMSRLQCMCLGAPREWTHLTRATANTRADNGWTPLERAALGNHISCTQWLVQYVGAEPVYTPRPAYDERWFTVARQYADARARCRDAARALLHVGHARKGHRDVFTVMAKAVWATRGSVEWEAKK